MYVAEADRSASAVFSYQAADATRKGSTTRASGEDRMRYPTCLLLSRVISTSSSVSTL